MILREGFLVWRVGGSAARRTPGSRRERASRSAARAGNLSIIAPAEIGEEVVPGLALGEECLVDGVGAELLIEPSEAVDVVVSSACGILASRAGFHEKSPVAGLGEEEFPSGLREAPFDQG
ncbi:MAG: hypothetical protein RLZZ399_2412 [Verrucomicrobiota bacterium]